MANVPPRARGGRPGPVLAEAKPRRSVGELLAAASHRVAHGPLRPLARRIVPVPLREQLRRLPRAMTPVVYRGSGVVCPCCDGRFRKFMPSWNRPGAICPGCGAQERHRAIWLFLRARRPELFAERLSVLHFAPEESFQRRLSTLPELRYVTADLELPHASEHFDIRQIPYPDDSFDVILCVHVLEHVDDDRRAMREMARVLKPSGWALILVPIDAGRGETYEDPSIRDPKERERAFWQRDHVRLYGRDFPDRLREEGFRVTVDPYVRDLDPEIVKRHGLGPHVMYLGRSEA